MRFRTRHHSASHPLAFVLSGGGARGLAHIGFLAVAEEIGLYPDLVVGASMGAVVGAMWCSGRSASEMRAIVEGLDARQVRALIELRPPARGLTRGRVVMDLLDTHLQREFSELAIPLATVSADLESGERVVSTTGSVPKAVRASLSVPFLFEPIESEGRTLVDGCVVEPLPVHAARDLGARRVVAVDVCEVMCRPVAAANGSARAAIGRLAPGPRMAVALASIDVMERELARHAARSADLVIRPDLCRFAQYELLSGPAIVEAGEQAAREALDALRRFL